MNITEKEKNLLRAIRDSEYQDGGDPIGKHVWLDYLVDSRSAGGVLTSLKAKGLVIVNIVPMAKSDNRENGITDSTVCLTAVGFAAIS